MTQIRATQPGVAGGPWTDTFTTVEILAGDTPAQVSANGALSSALATAGIPVWTPVHVDALTGVITLAVFAADNTAVIPNAITSIEIPAGVYAAGGVVPVWKAGMYNVDALNWPVSYTTDAQKLAAFDAATGCQIYTKKPYNTAVTL